MHYLFIVSFIWAISFGLTKGVLSSVSAGDVIVLRLLFALMVFLPFLRFKMFSSLRKLQLIGIGILQQGAAYVFYIEALKGLYSYEVAFFLVFLPLYVALFFDFFERTLNVKLILIALLTLIGSAIIYPMATFRPEAIKGFFLMQMCNVCFALGQVQYKHLQAKLENIPERYLFSYMYSGALVFCIIFFAFRGHTFEFSSISAEALLTLIGLGTIASGLGFFMWNKGVAQARKSVVVVANNLKIPLGVACSIFIFGEPASTTQLLLGASFFIAAFILEKAVYNRSLKKVMS